MRHLELSPGLVARAAIAAVNAITIYGPLRFAILRAELLGQVRGVDAGNASAVTREAVRLARKYGHLRGAEGWIEFPDNLTRDESSRMLRNIAAYSWT